MDENNTPQQNGSAQLSSVYAGISLLLILVSFAVCAYTIVIPESIIGVFASVFMLLALFAGLFYILKGCKKDAAKYFQTFVAAFTIAEAVSIISLCVATSTIFSAKVLALIFLFDVVLLALLVYLLIKKDLGVKKTVTMGLAILVFSAIDFIKGIMISAKAGAPNEALIGFATLSLGLTLLFMIYAKYKDKAARGSK